MNRKSEDYYMNNDKLNDLVKRVNGDFYVGVVGACRSGKSSFINKFMNLKILPYIDDENLKNKITDELPQTADGKQIMTVEPKFVPSQTINVNIGDINMNLRLVDSVGYVINNSLGYETEDGPRYVKTPWFDDEIEFKQAALIGTKKIMQNHSNLGIVITADGSFNDFSRHDYEEVEEDIVSEMKKLEKPFVIVLNTKDNQTEECKKLVAELEEKYNESVYACNIKEMTEQDIDAILSKALEEFPILELNINLPSYLSKIGDDINCKKEIMDMINSQTTAFKKMKEINMLSTVLKESSYFDEVEISLDNSSLGRVTIDLILSNEFIHDLMLEVSGSEIKSQEDLIVALYNGHMASKVYNEIGDALNNCKEYGYGVAIPSLDDMKLLPPTIVKQSGKYGVKVQAVAPSIHLIRVDVESSFAPIIGSLEQSKTLIDSLDTENEIEIWNKEIFGRKLSEIVNDGIKQKIYALPENSKEKLKDVMSRLVNSNRSSLIAIVL